MDGLQTAAHQVMLEYFQRCREAEQYRAEEQHAAVVVQACWRGCLQRNEIQRLTRVALTIQKCWRGHLGRQRFAAVLAAHNTHLRQAYFAHHATVIQKCWRGWYSRAHIHDFSRRKAFLQSVAARNAAVRAEMHAALQDGMRHQQQQAQAAAKQQFDAQVNRLHYLSSTASIPGIFSPPATAAAAQGRPPQAAYTVAGLPLEHHLRAAVKHKAAVAVEQQQAVLRRALATFPAAADNAAVLPGQLAAFAATAPPGEACRTAKQGLHYAPTAAAARGVSPDKRMALSTASNTGTCLQQQPLCSINSSKACSRGSSRSSSRSSQKQPAPPEQKLALRIVEACVDQVYDAQAQPNMPDGSFNPGLSLQQATDYEATREAADLERRLERGLMLVLHKGQPFIPIAGKPTQQQEAQEQPWSDQQSPSRAPAAAAPTRTLTPQQQRETRPWHRNKNTGGMFSKHLKQVY